MNQRLEKIVEIFGKGEQKNIASKIGVGERTFNNYVGGFTRIPLEVFENIKKTFPQLDSDWLLLGEGEMLKPNFETYDKYISESQLLSKKTTFGNVIGYNNVEGYNVEGDLKNNSDNSSHYDSKLLEEIDALKKENQRLQIESQGFQTENQKLQIENAKLTGKLEAYTEMRK